MFQTITFKSTLLATLIGALGVAIPARATITFDGSGTPFYQQTNNSPCIIGNKSCNQPTGFDDFEDANGAGGGGTYDFFSTIVYRPVTPFIDPTSFNGNFIPTSFTIGVDSNIATGAGNEILVFFKTWTCNSAGGSCVLDTANSYIPVSPFTTIPDNHNGNGFSDALLTGFSLDTSKYYRFEASVGNDTDGMEQFFIIPAGTPAVPEPVTSALVGSGLIALFFVRRRVRG